MRNPSTRSRYHFSPAKRAAILATIQDATLNATDIGRLHCVNTETVRTMAKQAGVTLPKGEPNHFYTQGDSTTDRQFREFRNATIARGGPIGREWAANLGLLRWEHRGEVVYQGLLVGARGRS
jgi:hypothetical protein